MLLSTYMIHYVFDGAGKHFCVTATRLDDGDAIRLAMQHAADGPDNYIALGTHRQLAERSAEKVGVTKVRWNLAV